MGKKVELQKKECVICGKSFMPKISRNVCCSEECKKIRDRQTSMAWQHTHRKPHKTFKFICCICGKTFTTNKPNRKTCSDECGTVHKRNITSNYWKKERAKKAQEAQKEQINKPTKSLAEFNAEARATGMTYGEYDKYLRLNGGAK